MTTTDPAAFACLPGVDCIVIYAVGSCRHNPGPGGHAATVRRIAGGKITSLDTLTGQANPTTNIRMEMLAVLHALSQLKHTETQPVFVFTNSLVVLKGMTQWRLNWIKRNWQNADGKPVANRDLWEQLFAAAEGREICWDWLRGHDGDPFNEEVKTLAQEQSDQAKGAEPPPSV